LFWVKIFGDGLGKNPAATGVFRVLRVAPNQGQWMAALAAQLGL
jgi:hypothetical protein